jgi:VWFA-related protein
MIHHGPRGAQSNRFTLHLLCLLMTSSLALHAQEPPTPASPAGAVPSARPAALAVVVLDREGRPTEGLTADAFSLTLDGEEVSVSGFDEVRPPQPGRPPVCVVLLFDNSSLRRSDRKDALEALTPFVNALIQGGAEVMVAASDSALTIVEPPTGDPTRVAAALDRLAQMPTGGDKLLARRRALSRDLASTDAVHMALTTPAVSSGGQPIDTQDRARMQTKVILGELGAHRADESGATMQALASLDELLRALSGLPGRRHVVWIGNGLPLHPGSELYATFFSKYGVYEQETALPTPEEWTAQVDLTAAVKEVVARAQYAGTTLHVLTTHDREPVVGAGDSRDGRRQALPGTQARRTTTSPGSSLDNATSPGDGTSELVAATGGLACVSDKNAGACLSHLAGWAGSYYLITLPSDGGAPSRPRSLQVELPGRDLQPRHLAAVLQPTAVDRLIDVTTARMWLDYGANPHRFTIALGEAKPGEGNRWEQTVNLSFPTDSLQWEPADGNHRASLVVALAAQDESGRPLPPQLVPLTLTVPSARLGAGTTVRTAVRLLMYQGSHRLAVGVLDSGSDTASTAAIAVSGPGP